MANPTATQAPDKRDIKNATTIEPLALNEEYVRLPGDMAHWASQYSDALDTHLRADAEKDRVYEELRLRVMRHVDARGEKATEKMVDAMVETDPEYQKAVLAEIDATVRKSRVSGVLDAVKAKRDMLISLGSHMRHQEEVTIYRDRRKEKAG